MCAIVNPIAYDYDVIASFNGSGLSYIGRRAFAPADDEDSNKVSHTSYDRSSYCCDNGSTEQT
jgi:hypothetical protein